MSTQAERSQPVGKVRRLNAAEVRQHTFNRAALGRRGLDEDEVEQYLSAVAAQFEALELDLEQLIDENRRLKHAMREWHREQMGFDSAELLARTQQEVEEQIARSESYSREREEEAARRYEAIVAEAYERAEEALAAAKGRVTAEGPLPPDGEGSGAVKAGEPTSPAGAVSAAAQTRVDGLLQALDGLAAHIEAARSAFAQEAALPAHGDQGDQEHADGTSPVAGEPG